MMSVHLLILQPLFLSLACGTVLSAFLVLETIRVLEAPHGDFMACMEMVKIAYLIAFVASAYTSIKRDRSYYYIDEFGSQCVSVFGALGLPSSAVLVRDIHSELKKRNDVKKTCISSLVSEFPEDCEFYPANTKDDLHKFLWLFREQRLMIPHWWTQRP